MFSLAFHTYSRLGYMRYTFVHSKIGAAEIVKLALCIVQYPLALSQARSHHGLYALYFEQMALLLSCRPETVRAWQIALCTANTLCRKFETNIPRNKTACPRSKFLHSCIFERFIFYHVRSDYFDAAKYVDRSW